MGKRTCRAHGFYSETVASFSQQLYLGYCRALLESPQILFRLDQTWKKYQSRSLQNLDAAGVIAKHTHRGELRLGTSEVRDGPSVIHILEFIKRPSCQWTETPSSAPGSLQPGPSGVIPVFPPAGQVAPASSLRVEATRDI